jgi:lysophospholipase L1-like esterase
LVSLKKVTLRPQVMLNVSRSMILQMQRLWYAAFLAVCLLCGFAIGGGTGAVDQRNEFSIRESPTSTTSTTAPAIVEVETGADNQIDYVLQVAIIGDSYTGGSPEGGYGLDGWPSVLDRSLREKGYFVAFQVAGLGGSGYSGVGPNGQSFVDAVPDVVRPDTDLVIFLGSRNELNVDPNVLRAAALEAYGNAQTIAPTARLTVIGAPWVNENIPEVVRLMNDNLAVAASQVGAQWVDPTVGEGWFFAEDAAMIGADGVHPTDDGHIFMASRIEPLVLNELG